MQWRVGLGLEEEKRRSGVGKVGGSTRNKEKKGIKRDDKVDRMMRRGRREAVDEIKDEEEVTLDELRYIIQLWFGKRTGAATSRGPHTGTNK
jgi:hypothetical protein